MRKMIVLLIALTCIMFSFTPLHAQQPWQIPCLPDCFDQPFGATMSHTMVLPSCPTCTLTVFYRTRTACPPINYQDLFIESVWAPCLHACLATGFSNDIKLLLNAVSEQMLIDNPMGFHPLAGEPCADNWRVMKGSCWSKDLLLHFTHPNQLVHSCSNDNCCLEMYTVCADQNGNRTVTQTNYIPPQDPTCQGNEGGTFDCTPVCGSIYR